MASEGYPGASSLGRPISGLDEVSGEDVHVFHAGTSRRDDDIVTSGGRVLGVTALGDTIEAARTHAYSSVGKIGFDGAHYRTDIAK